MQTYADHFAGATHWSILQQVQSRFNSASAHDMTGFSGYVITQKSNHTHSHSRLIFVILMDNALSLMRPWTLPCFSGIEHELEAEVIVDAWTWLDYPCDSDLLLILLRSNNVCHEHWCTPTAGRQRRATVGPDEHKTFAWDKSQIMQASPSAPLWIFFTNYYYH